MDFQRRSIHPVALISLALLVLLVLGFRGSLLAACGRSSPPPADIPLSFSTSPTPQPLPTSVVHPSSRIAILLSQIFGKKGIPFDPSAVEASGQLVDGTDCFDLYEMQGYLPIDPDGWQSGSAKVCEYVTARMAIPLNGTVTVTFLPPQASNCAPRGVTFHEQPPVIVLYADQSTSQAQVLATLAHELGHVLLYQQVPSLSDPALVEGMANWAAGEYWTAWKGMDFDSTVRDSINSGAYLSLYRNYDLKKAYDTGFADCLVDRDLLLTEFASFLDHLIRDHGMDALSLLFQVPQPEIVDNTRVIFPPSYREVYGLELNQLEFDWLAEITSSTH